MKPVKTLLTALCLTMLCACSTPPVVLTAESVLVPPDEAMAPAQQLKDLSAPATGRDIAQYGVYVKGEYKALAKRHDELVQWIKAKVIGGTAN